MDGITLKLFVAGRSARSRKAISTIKTMCKTECGKGYHLDVIDVLKNPEIAKKEGILATPTLVKCWPKPSMRIVGEFSNAKMVLAKLSDRAV